MAKFWIKSAIRHPGAFTRQAKAAGMSTAAFAREHARDSGTIGRRARLAMQLRKMARKRMAK